MTNLFRPTKIVTGTRRVPVRPPRTVKPPTEPGNPSALDPGDWLLFDLDENEVARSITYPTGVSGDMILIFSMTGPSAGVSSVSGFTEVWVHNQGNHQMKLWAKISDGSEASSVNIATGGTGSTLFASNRLVANGKTLSIANIEENTASAINPPALTPTTDDSAYIYLVACSYESNTNNPTVTYPTNYTNVIESTITANRPSLMIGQRSVSDDGTEDPSTFAFTTGTLGDNIVATVALPVGVPASVAEADHDHAIDDLSDVDTTTAAPASGDLLEWDGTNWVPTDEGLTTKGDLLVHDGTDYKRLTAGTNDHVLTADSGQALGVKWAAGGGGGGGSGAWTLLDSETLGSNGTITFSSIAGTHNSLMLMCYVRSTRASTDDSIIVQLGNGTLDTGSNYSYRWRRIGSSNADVGSTSGTSWDTGDGIPAANSAGDLWGATSVQIIGYAESDYKPGIFRTAYNDVHLSWGGGVWKSTDVIDIIKIDAENGDLAAGSSVWLYGVT